MNRQSTLSYLFIAAQSSKTFFFFFTFKVMAASRMNQASRAAAFFRAMQCVKCACPVMLLIVIEMAVQPQVDVCVCVRNRVSFIYIFLFLNCSSILLLSSFFPASGSAA